MESNRRRFLNDLAFACGVTLAGSRPAAIAQLIANGLHGTPEAAQEESFRGRRAGEDRDVDGHGNVWEWCRDYYHAQLPGGTDPDLRDVKGLPNRDGTYSRVRRGGAWIEEGWACRSACRLRYESQRRSDHIGFRVVAVER